MGKPKNAMPEWYRGLKRQTPIFVKIISQMMKKKAVISIAEKNSFPPLYILHPTFETVQKRN